MKNWLWKLCLVAGFLWLTGFNRGAVALAADDEPGGPGDRLQRLERRVNELAERQEQMMRRLGAPEERQGMPRPEVRVLRERLAAAAPPEAANPRRPLAAAGAPLPPPPQVQAHKQLQDLLGLVMLVAIICNILLAVWIFSDIRKRGEGSGIFIALALVAGIPTAIIYALVRIGDKKA